MGGIIAYPLGDTSKPFGHQGIISGNPGDLRQQPQPAFALRLQFHTRRSFFLATRIIELIRMNEFALSTLARLLHVLGVVFWIGGVAMVTTVLLPAVARMKSAAERVAFFEEIEGRFAWQARFTTLITGLSGLWLVHALQAWERFSRAGYWWMHAMVAVWAIFTLMLFVLEPLVLHRWFRRRAQRDGAGTFRFIRRLHWMLLSLSLVTIAGAVAGSHGWLVGA